MEKDANHGTQEPEIDLTTNRHPVQTDVSHPMLHVELWDEILDQLHCATRNRARAVCRYWRMGIQASRSTQVLQKRKHRRSAFVPCDPPKDQQVAKHQSARALAVMRTFVDNQLNTTVATADWVYTTQAIPDYGCDNSYRVTGPSFSLHSEGYFSAVQFMLGGEKHTLHGEQVVCCEYMVLGHYIEFFTLEPDFDRTKSAFAEWIAQLVDEITSVLAELQEEAPQYVAKKARIV
jgi:hypothetical protein